ncbi:hypothetical protein K2173_005540 [Erythroxylum novogranatense]|uniref:Uncharacterized protein n=1 Tax=Erythroxylum novogranatense TaxID=1862640 RepID=A0AAV8SK55_9ROSI|nr:hypothetical protein K2173_005540 [Erythroxylum novogranatense]
MPGPNCQCLKPRFVQKWKQVFEGFNFQGKPTLLILASASSNKSSLTLFTLVKKMRLSIAFIYLPHF